VTKELIISCPDRRVHEEVDRRHCGIHVKLAGGNIATSIDSLSQLVRKEGISRITDELHTDCGAMLAVDTEIRNPIPGRESQYGIAVKKFLISPYRDLNDGVGKWRNRFELENKTNVAVQRRALNEIVKRAGRPIDVSVSVIDTSRIQIPEEVQKMDHSQYALLIIRPSETPTKTVITKLGLVRFATYVEQPPVFAEALGDVELFVRNMGLRNVVFGITSAEERKQVIEDKALFETVFPDVEARLAET